MIEDAFLQADYAINITDTQGSLLRVNQAYLDLYKFNNEGEVLGKTQKIIRSPQTSDHFYQKLWQTISSGQTWRGDLTNRARDGSDVYVHLTISPIKREGKLVGYMGFSLDRAQQVLLERQLLHANKLMVLGTLGAGLAHELNNPLASILLDAEYLQDSLANSQVEINRKAALEATTSVIRGVERMRRVLEHLLLYSRKDRPSGNSTLLLKEVVEDSFLFLDRQLINRKIIIMVDLPPEIRISGNRTQLESVFHNLIQNSRDAFDDQDIAEKYISIKAKINHRGSVEITYEDNAGGIPMKNLETIFEPFFTTKPEGSGTGLGLSISRKIVVDHGGTIECQSEKGWTRFTLLFPSI